MNFKKLKAFTELIRPVNVAMVFLAIGAASLLAGAELVDWKTILLASLSGALIASGGYAINDYFDADIDSINRPDRPLPRGAVEKTEAWWIWRMSSSAGVILSAFLGPAQLFIALVWVISLYFYSKRFKRVVLIGNIIVSVATGLALLYGGLVVGNIERAFVPALFAFLVNFAREVVKDVEDMEGDAKGNAQTLPVKHGTKPALVLATVTLLMLIAATLAAFQFGLYNLRYLAVVALVDVALIIVILSMWRSSAPATMHKLSTVLKASMLLGMVAMYLGSS